MIRFYWVLRHSEAPCFEWFIQLLTVLEEHVSKDRAADSLGPKNNIEINIYVTRPPKGKHTTYKRSELATATRSAAPRSFEAGTKAGKQFSLEDLTRLIQNPSVSSKKQTQQQYGSDRGSVTPPKSNHAENRLQDIWVWNGRPDWDQIFANVQQRHPGEQLGSRVVGVAFCGTPIIGKDLKKNCRKYSSLQDACTFELQKENF